MSIDDDLKRALAHHRSGRVAEAEAIYQQVVAARPDHAEATHLLGLIAHQSGDAARAEPLLRRAVELSPREPRFHNGLGEALRAQRRRDEAIDAYHAAVALKADYLPALNNLSVALLERGGPGDAPAAADAARRVLQLDPTNLKAHNRLGVALVEQHRFAEAAEVLRAATRLQPNYASAYVNLGNAVSGLGDADAAVASYREALRLEPTHSAVHSNLLFAVNYLPDIAPQQVFEEHRRFDERHASPLKRGVRRHENEQSPERLLRVGYVSPDLTDHPMSFFIEPILRHHDPRQVEVFCYSNARRPDAVTARIRSLDPASHWRDICDLPDERVAAMIEQDRIDVLVDLAEHTTDNRLLVFARKPAPVQVTYLGYPQTTGLSAIDYKISQATLDPLGMTEPFHSERIARLPDTYFCYGPRDGTPNVGPGPAADAPFTFLSINGMLKVNPRVLATWGTLLDRVAGARLLIKGKGLETPTGRERMAALCRDAGIPADRIKLHPPGAFDDFMRFFDRGHVALDPFPYNGGTTTCHTLYMGVPVVTLSGPTALHRMGASVLTAVGLPDLVAHTPDEYVDIAARLAVDRSRVMELRLTMRSRMERSPVMDAATFTRHLESLYRGMWRAWLGSV